MHNHARAAYYGHLLDDDDAARDRHPMWRRILSTPGHKTTVAITETGRVVGFVSVKPVDTDESYELTGIYVDTDYWGTGVADGLYSSFLDERNTSLATLEVWMGNARALAFYRRRGWTPTGVERTGPGGFPFTTWQLAEG